jgi:hypothetical protein
MTRSSGDSEQTRSSYAEETQSVGASRTTAESSDPNRLPARSLLIVFAAALIVASLAARLVSWQSRH